MTTQLPNKLAAFFSKSVATACTIVAINSLLLAVDTQADDIDIYLKDLNLPEEEVTPNILLILDTSESMRLPVAAYNRDSHGFSNDNDIDGHEVSDYVSTKVYPGSANYAGGAGDKDFVYLYQKDMGIYYDYHKYLNKVHRDQIMIGTGNCDTVFSDLSAATPTTQKNIFYKLGTTERNMCGDESCNYHTQEPGSSGPQGDYVYCSSGGTPLKIVNANYHNFLQSYYRFTEMKTAAKNTLDHIYYNDKNVNLAMMAFNKRQGGYVFQHFAKTNIKSVWSSMKKSIDQLETSEFTPLAETLWEAGRYFRGETPDYSGSVSSAMNGSRFDSPIDYQCQKNHIVLLTDGEPTYDNASDSKIKGKSVNIPSVYTPKYSCSSPSRNGDSSGSCLPHIADWLFQSDHALPGIGKNLTGNQNITTYSVGFGLDSDLLKAAASDTIADRIDENYFTASNAEELSDALIKIIGGVIDSKDSFVAPSVAVNSYNGLFHRSDLYFSLFRPSASPRWTGNIKKYRFVNGEIQDAKSAKAINPTTGYFEENALSFWTTPTDWDGTGLIRNDGDSVAFGGFAYELKSPLVRNQLTYTGPSPINSGTTPIPISLTGNTEYIFEPGNGKITTENLNLGISTASSEDERNDIIKWATGYGTRVSDPPNYFVGDFIHNQPVTVTYTTIPPPKDSDGNNIGDPDFDDVVYAASNLGFLHAIDAGTGSEIFSFIPKELLPNLTNYYRDTGSSKDKAYGLDAPLAVWRKDTANDGTIGMGDHVYLYQAMRRGGTQLYALDVTNRNRPELIWQINGTSDDSTSIDQYRDLAQTWSVPQLGTIRWACTGGKCEDKKVLFFGGGYDTVHDTATSPTTNDKGNAIYMVDATTGKLLWSAGNGVHHDLSLVAMQNSFPADVNISDINGDGYIDKIFAVDILGNLWRFDFNSQTTSSADFASGGNIATLGGTGNNMRRFFNKPDVALITKRGIPPFLTISIASGHRASPNQRTIQNGLFVIHDKNTFTQPTDALGKPQYNYVTDADNITPANLTDISIPYTNLSSFGWKLPFGREGEKGLSRTLTFDHKILMSTFIPSSIDGCEGGIGKGSIYILDVLTGVSKLSNNKQFSNLMHSGIPPRPIVIFGSREICVDNCAPSATDPVIEERPDLTVCIGTECIDGDLDLSLKKTYWKEDQ